MKNNAKEQKAKVDKEFEIKKDVEIEFAYSPGWSYMGLSPNWRDRVKKETTEKKKEISK